MRTVSKWRRLDKLRNQVAIMHADGWRRRELLGAFRHAGWLVGDFLASSACLLALVFVGVRVVFGGLFYPLG